MLQLLLFHLGLPQIRQFLAHRNKRNVSQIDLHYSNAQGDPLKAEHGDEDANVSEASEGKARQDQIHKHHHHFNADHRAHVLPNDNHDRSRLGI